jgi:hypothetical protein
LQGEGNAKTVKKGIKKVPKSLGQKKVANIDNFFCVSPLKNPHQFSQETDFSAILRTGLRSQGNKRLVAGL